MFSLIKLGESTITCGGKSEVYPNHPFLYRGLAIFIAGYNNYGIKEIIMRINGEQYTIGEGTEITFANLPYILKIQDILSHALFNPKTRQFSSISERLVNPAVHMTLSDKETRKIISSGWLLYKMPAMNPFKKFGLHSIDWLDIISPLRVKIHISSHPALYLIILGTAIFALGLMLNFIQFLNSLRFNKNQEEISFDKI